MRSAADEAPVNPEAMTPAALLAYRRAQAHFQRAPVQAKLLGRILVVGILLAAALAGMLWPLLGSPTAGSLLWQRLLITYLAALLVLLAALYAVRWNVGWRAQLLQNSSVQPAIALRVDGHSATDGTPQLPVGGWRARSIRYIRHIVSFSQAQLRAHWQSAGALWGLVLFATLALLLVLGTWNLPAPLDNSTAGAVPFATGPAVIGGIPLRLLGLVGLLALAFAMLVLERYYSANRAKELPEAVVLVCFLRVSMTISLVLGIALLLVSEERQWPFALMRYLAILPAAMAVELLLRALLSLFAPPQQQAEPELLATSLIAAMWRWPIQPLRHFQDELHTRFGIDLRQSWAFAYMRRALLPVMAGLCGIAWLASGLTEIGIAERGIYERFGNPVAVWQPGLHLGLPWPLGQVLRAENGVVHELATALPGGAGAGAQDGFAVQRDGELVPSVEQAAPVSANRLWDASHSAEKSQIIASQVNTRDGLRQSFHIVNMDVRVMYRIGLTDADALNARYQSADLPALIRATANRILVRYFASRTLEGVLGSARQQLALDIGAQLQADLRALNSGVEIMATVLEAIHPPAAAANAYHSVQAAQITATAIIARERGNAAQAVNVAQVRAGIARDQATAGARETLATAEVAEQRFNAEQQAYREGGKAFLWEQYFAQLVQGLSDVPLTLVDHRIAKAGTTIDLRRFAVRDVANSAPATGGRASDPEE